MKRLFAYISAVILAFFLLSCGKEASHRFSLPRESRSGVLLTGLDSLVDANPDSALKMLDAAIKQEENKIGKSVNRTSVNLMRLELLRAKAKNKACVPFSADSLAVMQRVADYYHRKGNANDCMLSLYLLGCAYRDLGSAPRAIETWQQAVAEVDTTRADCDLSTLMRIHSQMNALYTRMRLPELAKGEIEKAQKLCWKMRDTINAMHFKQDNCNTLYNKGKYDECIKKTLDLYHQYLNYGQKEKAALVTVYCIRSYLALEDYAKAKEYLDIYETSSYLKSDRRKIDGGLAPYYIYKGNYYMDIGNMDSAEYCFRQAMPEMSALHNDVDVYYRLYQINAQRHKPDSMFKYANLFYQAEEKKFEDLKTQATIEAKSLYDYSVEQRIAKEEREKIARLKDIGYAFFLIVMAILSALGTFYYKERKQAQRLRTQLSTKEKKLEQANQGVLELQNQEMSLRSNLKEARKQHKEEVKEIASQLAAITDEKEELLRSAQELRGQIDMLRTENKIKEMGSKAQALENTDVVHQIKEILNNPIAYHITNTHWKELVAIVNKTHPEFYNCMNRYHSLTKEEYRVCLLTLIGCSSRDINVLMDKSNGYASNCKKRLHLMVFNQPGTAKDFAYNIRTLM